MHSSPSLHCPATPAALRRPLAFKPSNSSPLAESSPVVAAQARRQSQYKARSPATPIGTSMREAFRARCIERAVKERKKALAKRRYVPTEPSSDDYPMNDDESEDDDEIMKDELFRRIMEHTNRRHNHSFRVSYAVEVGSSFDPNIDDIDYWERELTEIKPAELFGTPPSTSTSTIRKEKEIEQVTPFDLDDEELEAYAEEYARITALADFEDLPEEELFNRSDFEELHDFEPVRLHCTTTDDMDTS